MVCTVLLTLELNDPPNAAAAMAFTTEVIHVFRLAHVYLRAMWFQKIIHTIKKFFFQDTNEMQVNLTAIL